MATRIAWLLNFDADFELREPARYRPRVLSPQLRAALRARIAELIGPDDCVLGDDPSALASEFTALAFCPTPSACARIAQQGLTPPIAPSLAVLRAVNDRAFCAELGHGLAHACFVRDMASLEQHLARAPGTASYVLKRAFSFAGRGQRRMRAGELDVSSRGFCARSFARGEGIQVEPWVERVLDVSKHGYLTQSGAVFSGPSRTQRVDGQGRYLGVHQAPSPLRAAEEQQLCDELDKTGAALHRAGYFGPFGIDGFRYRHAGQAEAFNPRCEINARFTLGYPRALLVEALATHPASR